MNPENNWEMKQSLDFKELNTREPSKVGELACNAIELGYDFATRVFDATVGRALNK
ncbi:MAG: hypothetical protein WCT36_00890 [Candidatus Gracilibacteria bacterium]|jgi:hypothetical protein